MDAIITIHFRKANTIISISGCFPHSYPHLTIILVFQIVLLNLKSENIKQQELLCSSSLELGIVSL